MWLFGVKPTSPFHVVEAACVIEAFPMSHCGLTHLRVKLITFLSFGAAMGTLISTGHEFAAQGWVGSVASFARNPIATLSLAVEGTDWFRFFFSRFGFGFVI